MLYAVCIQSPALSHFEEFWQGISSYMQNLGLANRGVCVHWNNTKAPLEAALQNKSYIHIFKDTY